MNVRDVNCDLDKEFLCIKICIEMGVKIRYIDSIGQEWPVLFLYTESSGLSLKEIGKHQPLLARACRILYNTTVI